MGHYLLDERPVATKRRGFCNRTPDGRASIRLPGIPGYYLAGGRMFSHLRTFGSAAAIITFLLTSIAGQAQAQAGRKPATVAEAQAFMKKAEAQLADFGVKQARAD